MKGTPMVIKLIETKEEIKGKASVHFQAWKEAYTGMIDRSYLDRRTHEQSEQMAKSAFEKGYAGFIAKEGERVIGFVDYGKCRDNDLKNAGEVYAIYILKEYCGQGVGQALMNHSLEAMREYEKAAVWVLEENQRAIHFYRKCGFREDGMKKVLNLGTPVSEIRMMTEL